MPSRRPLLKACLNGARPVGSVAGLPVTPSEVARDALAAWEAGARAVHVHPRNAKGREGLDAGTIGATVTAIRSDVPDVPVGVSTGAWIEPDADARLALVRSWQVLPDFASVNWHEDGAERIAEVLVDLGVGVEAGIWTADAARTFVGSPMSARCLRVLIEPRDSDVAVALGTADEVGRVLDGSGNMTPRLLHGTRAASWGVLRAALEAGLDMRIGLEDTNVLPDGTEVTSNVELVTAAMRLIEGAREG